MTKTCVYLLIALSLIMLLSSETLAHEKVVVVPLSSSKAVNPLQGQGRPGTALLTHATLNGYCTGPTGVNFALSESLADWGAAASVCPADTWVCSLNELPTSGTCEVPTSLYYESIDCSGVTSSHSMRSSLMGWTSDRRGILYGTTRASQNFSTDESSFPCFFYRVWCCWK